MEKIDYSKYKKVGGFSWRYNRKTNFADLYDLNSFDETEYKHVQFKEGEKLFRYSTDKMFGLYLPLVKINVSRKLIYFFDSKFADKDRAYFEKRGIKLQHLRID